MTSVSTPTAIEATYSLRTRTSDALMQRARGVMSAGSTRTFGFFEPYPLVFERGEGSLLFDVDGNSYIDFAYNGLSLIHGHAYPPVTAALHATLDGGTAWPGSSHAQIAFAELLVERIPKAEKIRFANTGTEATMLAVKLARRVTDRPLILKALHAYHGSYDDLEAGLGGRGEMPGRTLLAEFGNTESFRAKIAEAGDDLAAVVLEPMLYTDRVVPPPPGFLPAVAEAARAAGALVILDDCLMFRLAPGGSAERYGFDADITCLGKWIGGGLPVGAIGGSADLMATFDPTRPGTLYHGGSFNGNPLGCVAGRIAVEELTGARIATMDGLADVLVDGIERAAADAGVPLLVSGDGSARGVYVLVSDGGPVDAVRSRLFYLASLNRGVYVGAGGELAMATTLDDGLVAQAIAGFTAALADVAALDPDQEAP
jgi:glutamate-1-semialdehyde 2,1-aminomutase